MLEYEIRDGKYYVKDDTEKRYKVFQITEESMGTNKGMYNYYLSLLAHEKDFDYVKAYINQMFFGESTSLIDGALINSAIQLMVRCFTNPQGKGRNSLNETKVFHIHAQEMGKPSFINKYNQFFEARRKNLAHDEDAYKDNIIGLTFDLSENKPLEIQTISVRTGYLFKQNADDIVQMADIALDYIDKQKKSIEIKFMEYFANINNEMILKLEEVSLPEVIAINRW